MMNSMSASSYTGIYIGRSSFSYSVVVFPLAVQKQESLWNFRKRQCNPPLVGSLKGRPWLQVETFPVHQEVNTKGSEIASRGAAPVGLAVTPAGQVVWRRSWVGRRILDAIGILLVTCYSSSIFISKELGNLWKFMVIRLDGQSDHGLTFAVLRYFRMPSEPPIYQNIEETDPAAGLCHPRHPCKARAGSSNRHFARITVEPRTCQRRS